MAFSRDVKRRLEVALGNEAAADAVESAIFALGIDPAAVVAALGATSNLSALAVAPTTFATIAGTYAVPSTPTGSEVDATVNAALAAVKDVVDIKADNADVETLRTQTESRLDAIETKVDAILTALKNAGLMASS